MDNYTYLQSSWRSFEIAGGYEVCSVIQQVRIRLSGIPAEELDVFFKHMSNGVKTSQLQPQLTATSNISSETAEKILQRLRQYDALIERYGPEDESANGDSLFDRQIRFFNAYETQTVTGALASGGTAAAVYSIIVEILGAAAIGYQIRAAWVVGQKNRENQNGTSGQEKTFETIFGHALLLTYAIALVSFLTIWLSEPLLRIIIDDTAIISDAVFYLRYRSPSIFLAAKSILLVMTINIAGKPIWTLYNSIVVVGFEIILKIILIFGLGPIPYLALWVQHSPARCREQQG